MFKELEKINSRPLPFEVYSASDLWTDDHISKQMLNYHLNPDVDAASRNAEFISRSRNWIIDTFNLTKGNKVADFGCGPGLYTTAFAEAGADVTGIDFSKNSIEYAKGIAQSKNLDINYINQNYLDFATTTRFDLITMIMCDICALSSAQRGTMLMKYYDLLAPGGAVLLDAYSLQAFAEREESISYGKNLMNGFWSADTYYGFLNVFKYEEAKVVLDKYTIIEDGRIRTVYNWLQYFDSNALIAEFKNAGFNKVSILGDVAGSLYQNESNEFAVVAHK